VIKVIVLHPHADTEYHRTRHLDLSKVLPGLRKFTISEAMPDPLTGEEPPYNLVNEVYFDDIESYKKAFRSPEVERALADVPKFSDLRAVITIVSFEEDVPLPSNAG
jgi:uncharacterized protein (TIGR02118 family)